MVTLQEKLKAKPGGLNGAAKGEAVFPISFILQNKCLNKKENNGKGKVSNLWNLYEN